MRTSLVRTPGVAPTASEREGQACATAPSGQGSNSVQVRQYNERVILTLLAPARRGLQGRSRAPRPAHQQHRRADRPRSRGAAPGPHRRQAHGRARPARHHPAPQPRRRLLDRLQARPPLARRAPGRFRRPGDRAPPPGARLPDAGGGGGVRQRERRRAAAPGRRLRPRHGSPGWASPCPTISAAGSASSTSRWPPTGAGTSSTSAARLAGATGLEVFCENDGTAAAVAELFQGQDRSLDDFLYVFVGAAARRRRRPRRRLPPRRQRQCRRHRPDADRALAAGYRAARRTGGPRSLLTRASVNALIRHLRGSRRAGREPRAARRPPRAGPSRRWTSGSTMPPTRWCCRSSRRRACSTCAAVVIDGTLPRTVLDQLIARLGSALGGGLARVARAAAAVARHGRPRRAGDRGRDPAAAPELQPQSRCPARPRAHRECQGGRYMAEATGADARDARDQQDLPRREGAEQRAAQGLGRRGPGADGRERRRQVDADEDPLRRLPRRRRAARS